MWDCEPVLYWRVGQDGKRTWKKANAARFMTEMGTVVWVIEPPIPKRTETDESEGESDD